jgi:nucleoside-diphosphate-sugar epimerase
LTGPEAAGRVLVTGATGFIGRHVLEPLLARGFEVHATYRGSRSDHGAVIWHKIDLLDSASVATLASEVKASHLLHLAWYAEHGKFWTSERNVLWLEASLALARHFAAAGGRRMVAVGTSAEYQITETPSVEEVTPLIPATLYGAAKLALATTLGRWAPTRGVSLAWARVFHLFGPGEHPDRLVPALTRAALTQSPLDCGPGEQARDFLHAADVAEACAAILAHSIEGPVNIGSGQPVRVSELVALIEAATGSKGIARLGARRANTVDARFLAPDVTRLRREVGWTPGRELEESLRENVAWWSSQLAAATTAGSPRGAVGDPVVGG